MALVLFGKINLTWLNFIKRLNKVSIKKASDKHCAGFLARDSSATFEFLACHALHFLCRLLVLNVKKKLPLLDVFHFWAPFIVIYLFLFNLFVFYGNFFIILSPLLRFFKKSHVEYSCSSHGCDLRAHSSVSFVPWINLIFEFHSDEMFCKLFHVNLWINYYFWGTHRTKRIWRDSGFNVEPCVCVCPTCWCVWAVFWKKFGEVLCWRGSLHSLLYCDSPNSKAILNLT